MSRWPIAVFAAGFAAPAMAACPIELATYRDRSDIAEIEFRPSGSAAAITNTFHLLIRNGPVLDGIVMWTEVEPRPVGQVTYQCPEGDVTGEEIEACTVWQGVIYTTDFAGTVSLLPAEGSEAPPTLILSALGPGIRHAPAVKADILPIAPADVFKLSGCQE